MRWAIILLALLLGRPAAAQPGTAAFGNIVKLNGSTDRIAASTIAFNNTDNFTLEAYVRPAALPTGGFETIINNGFDNGSTGNGLAVGIGGPGGAGGSQLIVLFSGLQFFDTGFTFPAAGHWYHVAVTRRSGILFAYVDGVQAPNTSTTAPLSPGGSFSVGAQNGIRFLHGDVDEARAWSVGRTQSQIQAAATSELTGTEPDLEAYWDMNRSGQGAGLLVLNQATATGSSLDGTTAGTAGTPVFAPDNFGNAVTMDGSAAGISIPTAPALTFGAGSSFTIEAFVKLTATANGSIIFSQQRCTAGTIQLIAGNDGIPRFRVEDVGNTGATLAGPAAINDGHWHHLAGVRDVAADQLRFYVDGQLVQQQADATTGAITNASTENWLGQRFPCAFRDFFTGAIDEFRVWNTARSQADIQTNLNNPLLGSEAGLVAYFDMNRSGQGAGLTVQNKAAATGAALNGSTVGTASTPVFSLANNPGITAAGTFTVTALAPTRNTNTAPQASNVALTFSQDVQASTAANVSVYSARAGGRKSGSATVSSSVLTFDPGTNFAPGEVVQVSVPATVQSLLGTPATPHVHQFTTAAGAGPGLFSKRTVVNVGTGLGAVTQADVDGDGDLDLLVADGSLNTVSVRLNNGDASYSGGSTVSVGNGASCLVVADLDGDGDLDLATGNENANSVSIRLNNGSGTYSGTTTLATGNFEPRSIVAGDVDGDGDLDLVVANNTSSGTVRTFLNNGTGLSYTNAPDVTGIVFPIGLALGDVDADGDLDLAISSNLVGGTDAYLRLNNGSGTFGGSSTIPVGASSIYSALADVDGDADLDLLTANIGSDDVSVRLNNGSGAFSGGSTVPVGDRPCALTVGDLDGDGDLDFAAANNSTPGSLSFRFNNGSGTFSGTLNAAAGNQPLSVAVGDADGDLDLDVAMIEGAQTAVYLNQPAPTITSFSPGNGTPGTLITLTGTNFLGAVSVSFNGTATVPVSVPSGNSLTVLVPNGATSGPISVTTGSGTGSSAVSFTVVVPSMNITALSPARNANAAPRPGDVAITFDQAPGAATAGNVRVFSSQTGGRRAGTANVAGNTLIFNPTTDFKAGDVLRVSVPGSVQSTGGSAAVPQVYQFTAAAAAGPLTFSGSTVAAGTGPAGTSLADVNGDGHPDLLVANASGSTVSVRLNNGTGQFSGGSEVSVGSQPRTVTMADLDGDSDLDLLSSNSGTNTVSVRLNDGGGNFNGIQNVTVGSGVTDVAAGDVDGDGDLDFVAASFSTNALSIRLNNGSGTFGGSGSVSTGAGSGPFFVALADVDNDGDLDALASYNTSGGVGLFLNDGGGTFSSGAVVSTGAAPRGLALADVDNDGDLDLGTVNTGASTVSINFNTAGSFGSPVTLPASSGRSLALADFNGDSAPDLLISDGNTVALRLNSGSGSFGSATSMAVGASAQGVAVADLDGDNDLDFATANFSDNTVSVRLSQPAPTITSFLPGSGSVGTYVTLSGSGFLGATGISFNGTPATVFTVASGTSATVQVPAGATSGPITLTTGSGTATSASPFTVVPAMSLLSLAPSRHALAAAPAANVSATFSQALDPASLTPQPGIPPVLRVFGSELGGRRSGSLAVSGPALTFAPSQNFRPGERVAVSLPPGVVRSAGGASGPGAVWQFTTAVAGGSGNFVGGPDLPIAAGSTTMHAADLDGDGDLDVLSASFSGNTVNVLLNAGSNTFTTGSSTPVGPSPASLAVGDVDADGNLDFVTANSSGTTVSVRLGNGSGGFTGSQEVPFSQASPAVSSVPQRVLLLDVDADADLDLVTLASGSTGSRALYVRLNNGAGVFATAGGMLTLGTNFPLALEGGDLDNDGDLDLLVGYSNSSFTVGGVRMYRNNGAGVFTFIGDATIFIPNAVALRDVDADGDLDLLQLTTFGTGSSSLLTALNNGSGGFGSPAAVSLGTGTNPLELTLADIDADGDQDALVANAAASTVSVCRNNGSGTFGAPVTVGVEPGPRGLTTGDTDNDGDVDLLTTNGATVSLRLNQAALPAPTISSFTPTHAVAGSSIVVTGTNLSGATAVSFNGSSATGFTVNAGGTQLTVSVPAGASTGPIAITTPAGTASSATIFELDLLLNATATINAGTYHDVTVAAGTATMGGNVTINGTLAVQAGSTLADNCAVAQGGGSFTLAAGATLQVCHPAGLGAGGTIQTTGPNIFSPDASYVFNGSSAQVTGAGLPSRVRNLTADNPAGLTLSAPTSVALVLTVAGSGDFDLNGQALTLLSDNTGTALVVNSSSGVVLGTATVQRYISPALNSGRGYRHLSAPVSGQAVGGLATGLSPVVTNPLYNTSPTPGSVTPFPTIFGYDESRVPAVGNTVADFDRGWVSPTAPTEPMPVGQGYTMQARGNETLVFSGPLNSGSLSLGSLSHGAGPQAGWHLLGNPYPAPLDWSTLDASSFVNMGSAVYVFQSTGQYTGSYRVYQAGIGDPIIALGQGVFVRSTSPNAQLNLSNANRVTTFSPSGSELFRTTVDRRPQLHLTLQGPGGATPDPTYIYFDAAATAGLDAQADAYKLRNPGQPSLFSLLGAEELSINGLSPLTSLDVVVPLGLAVPVAGQYTLRADQLLNLGSTTVYLRDAETGAVINLSQQPTYSFSMPASALSSRFSVLFRPAALTATHGALEASQVALFPNPARQEVTVLVPALPASQDLRAELVNALSQVVLVRTLPITASGVEARLNLQGLAAGVYSLRLTAGSAAPLTKRLVIE